MNVKWKNRLSYLWREWARPLVVVVVVLGTFRSAVADWYDVPSGSMQPTLLVGDRILVNKLAYDLKIPFTPWRLARWSGAERSDVVVLYSPRDQTRLVKRVVGLGGERIELRGNRLLVNGQAVEYRPLDEAVIARWDEPERGGHLFAVEMLDETGHPVMSTPGQRAPRYYGPVVVPKDHYLVMGDNRDNSMDSRHWGFVHRDRIVGQATRVVLSLDREHHYRPRWERFLRTLP